MNLTTLQSIFEGNGCRKMYVKKLSVNDDNRHQVYLGGSFEVLNVLPISRIRTVPAGDWTRERFKVDIDFNWVGDDGSVYPAPQSKLILYPKYPEVRFSGMLVGCENAPSVVMKRPLAGRLLFLSVTSDRRVLGYVTTPRSILAREFNRLTPTDWVGTLQVVDLPQLTNNRRRLIAELRRIHARNWITSKRLNKDRQILPCPAQNCGGYTLEAELGITPNGSSEPDYLGWEIKQFAVDHFDRVDKAVVTLMTPEPTGGFYQTRGRAAFILKYGYADLQGRKNRMNFGGIHKAGERNERTNLQLELIGFDHKTGRIRKTDGMIALLDRRKNIAASWSFADLMVHWSKKHNQACYVPSLKKDLPKKKYKYGDEIMLGTGTDFEFFLKELSAGIIYYDPGIKMGDVSSSSEIKTRNQFRIRSGNLNRLYRVSEVVKL